MNDMSDIVENIPILNESTNKIISKVASKYA